MSAKIFLIFITLSFNLKVEGSTKSTAETSDEDLKQAKRVLNHSIGWAVCFPKYIKIKSYYQLFLKKKFLGQDVKEVKEIKELYRKHFTDRLKNLQSFYRNLKRITKKSIGGRHYCNSLALFDAKYYYWGRYWVRKTIFKKFKKKCRKLGLNYLEIAKALLFTEDFVEEKIAKRNLNFILTLSDLDYSPPCRVEGQYHLYTDLQQKRIFSNRKSMLQSESQGYNTFF